MTASYKIGFVVPNDEDRVFAVDRKSALSVLEYAADPAIETIKIPHAQGVAVVRMSVVAMVLVNPNPYDEQDQSVAVHGGV